jgi:hypothetical protein
MLGVKDAHPSYLQATIYNLTTDFLGVGWWKVEGIINEIELINPSFPPASDPPDNSLRGMSPDNRAFNRARAAITTAQGTSSSGLNWHPEFFLLRW